MRRFIADNVAKTSFSFHRSVFRVGLYRLRAESIQLKRPGEQCSGKFAKRREYQYKSGAAAGNG